jgi:hypothetical protein
LFDLTAGFFCKSWIGGTVRLNHDAQVEYPIRDRISFMRFLGLGLENAVPDATAVRLFISL